MNRVELVGRLTRDPELRTVSSGSSVATFTVAVNRPFTPQNGERDADFINCRVWNKQAENLAKFCHKGDQIGVEGSIRTSNYTDKEGNKRYTTDVQLDSFEFVESKKSAQEASSMSQETPYDFAQDNQSDSDGGSVDNDPFADFGDSVSIDENFLD